MIFLSITFTFGILTPWVIVSFYKWEIENTYIEGRRLRFEGSAISLVRNWLIWLFLSIITFGIYSFWVYVKLRQWKIKNTYFCN